MLRSRTSDLAAENFGLETASSLHFPKPREYVRYGFGVSIASRFGHSYHTVTSGRIWADDTAKRQLLCKLIAEIITEYREHARGAATLTVGLGSASITADSLGSLTVDRVLVTDAEMQKSGLAKMCAINPGVPAKTGLDTAVTVREIAKQSSAELIITVDSLSAVSPDRLCTVVQITDCGVVPGSALSHSSGEISTSTMPCPVISIGVPTVIRADLLSGNKSDSRLLVSPADTDVAVSCYASIIAGGINLAHMGNITG